MDATAFCTDLLDALEAFDQEIAPLGLYASEDLAADNKPKRRKSHVRFEEWHRCLKPHLQKSGCATQEYRFDPDAWVRVPDLGSTRLRLIKISKIKVRKYGSHYRVDKHENYNERWQQLRMDRHLSDLWSPSALADSRVRLRTLIFIGFDKTEPPFERELSQLRQSPNWEKHEAIYLTRTWQDRYQRGFNVRLFAWAKMAPAIDESAIREDSDNR